MITSLFFGPVPSNSPITFWTVVPAIVAAVGSSLLTLQTLPHIVSYFEIIGMIGAPFALVLVGTPMTFASAVIIAVLPPPPPPRDPQIAPARLVD